MDIKLTQYSMSPWEERLESLASLLNSQVVFRPDRWGRTEPLKHAFPVDDLRDMQKNWNRYKGVIFKGSEPRFWMSLEWWSQCKHPARLSMGVEERFFGAPDNVQIFLEFAASVYLWGEMVYGFACHSQDYEQKNKLSKPTMIDGKLVAIGGTNILRCLPGVYWANFFGKPYVQWFGKEKLRSAPCHALKELPDGGIFVLTGTSPTSYNEAWQTEMRLRSHLGADAFFDRSQPTRPCRSPFL